MKKYAVYPLLALAGGAAAFVLRLAQNRTGFEAATGLPVAGNLWSRLLVGLLVLTALVCLLLTRKLPAEPEEQSPGFSDAFSTHSSLLLMVLVTGVFLFVLSGLLEIAYGLGLASGAAEGSVNRLSLLLGGLTLVCGGCFFSVLPACRRAGAREAEPCTPRTVSGDLLLLPVGYLVVRLVTAYRTESINPVLEAYYIDLLALVLLTLTFYRLSSFAFHAGQTRRFLLYAIPAVVLCLTALADSRPLYDTLFFAGGALTALGFLLLRLSALAASKSDL